MRRPSFDMLFLLYEAKYVEYYDYHEERDYHIGAYLIPKIYTAVPAVMGKLGFVLLPAPYLGNEETDQYTAERHEHVAAKAVQPVIQPVEFGAAVIKPGYL